MQTRGLHHSQARFRAVFEEAGIGIALIDRAGRLEEANPALVKMLGYGAEELRGRPLVEFAHPGDATADGRPFQELMEGKRDRYGVGGRYVRKDGQPCWVNLIVTPVPGIEGRPQFAIAMVEDLTEWRQMEEALVQSEKLALAGRLAASLAHEINNPLQAVIGCLGLAEESLAAGEDATDLLQIAMEELERAAGIVAQLRDLNRRSKPEDRELTDVDVLVEQVLVLTRKRCQNQDVEVACKVEGGLPYLMLVPDRMQQVFLNLVLNAVEAMPDGGRLEVSTGHTAEPAEVYVAFTDSGHGVARDDLSHIFDPFYTTKPDGLGLGLYISRSIVEEHGGRIEVESQVGEGATFRVWLPQEGDG